MRLNIKYGIKEFELEVDGHSDAECQAENSDGNPGTDETETQKAVPKNLGELRQVISEHCGYDLSKMKLIHRCKIIVAPMEEPLSKLNFKDRDKIMVMGTPAKQDPGLTLLLNYEKAHLMKLSDAFKTNGDDITELERNFLEGGKLTEMLKRMDKRLKEFTEAALRHLESIDGLKILAEDTPEEQKRRNREKRKCLVDGIQTLLRENDKFAFRLQQYRTSLDYK